VPAPDSDQPIFYFDLGSPDCYLAAETIMAALPVVPEWEPVHATAVCDGVPKLDRAQIERRAAALELQPLRWPSEWPTDTYEASLAATYAKRVGRAVVFSLAAFRQEFAGGQDLGRQSTVLIAGAACEMHPTALLKAIGLRSTIQALEQANGRARGAGVRSLPAIEVRGAVFEGEHAVDQAASAIGSRR